MLIIGLTGSIGMGKSTAATRFRELGVPVADADAIVHELYRGRAVPLVEAAFPGSTRDGVVDRQRLSAALLADPKRFKQLEAVVHPLVHEVQRAFIDDAAAHGKSLIVLENPLLIEMGGHTRVDVVVVVSARPEQQRERVLARPGIESGEIRGDRGTPDTGRHQTRLGGLRCGHLRYDRRKPCSSGQNRRELERTVRRGVRQALKSSLVFRLRHLVLIAAPDRPSVGDMRNTSNSMILVQLMHLTLDREPSRRWVSSVRCAALEQRI